MDMHHARFFIILLCLTACDPCRNLDCVTDDYDGQFRIVSATDGTELLFGTQKLYTADSIQFYTLQRGDTTFLNGHAELLRSTGYDSILRVRFFPKADTAYMRLSNGDVDTLQLEYATRDTRCCGTITELTNIRYNKKTLSGKGIQEIRK
jgi:hypothetical protein